MLALQGMARKCVPVLPIGHHLHIEQKPCFATTSLNKSLALHPKCLNKIHALHPICLNKILKHALHPKCWNTSLALKKSLASHPKFLKTFLHWHRIASAGLDGIWNVTRIYLCGERFVNPLHDKASLKRSVTRKKKTLCGSFFRNGLWPVLPLGQ